MKIKLTLFALCTALSLSTIVLAQQETMMKKQDTMMKTTSTTKKKYQHEKFHDDEEKASLNQTQASPKRQIDEIDRAPRRQQRTYFNPT